MDRMIEKWTHNKLELIVEKMNKYQIKSAYQLYDKIEGMEFNHVLVTWYFASMFTNIPFHELHYLIQLSNSWLDDVRILRLMMKFMCKLKVFPWEIRWAKL